MSQLVLRGLSKNLSDHLGDMQIKIVHLMCGWLFYFFLKNNLLSENPLKYVMAEVRTEATKTKIRESYLVILM